MLMRLLPISQPLFNIGESLIDHIFRDKVQPEAGSVLYCDLFLGYAEHSGVYVGNDEIVHLNRYGCIEKVSADEFIEGTTAMNIYVSSANSRGIGSQIVCERALNMVGKKRNYNVLLDNCHQFTSGCLTGNFENRDNFLMFLKMQTTKVLRANEWRVWKR